MRDSGLTVLVQQQRMAMHEQLSPAVLLILVYYVILLQRLCDMYMAMIVKVNLLL